MDQVLLRYKNNTRGQTKNSKGEKAIVLEVYCNRKRKHFPTKIILDPKFWDEKNGIVKKNSPQEAALNSQLSNLKKIHELFIDEMNRKFNGFKFEYYKYFNDGSASNDCFLSYMTAEIKRRQGNDITPSTFLSQNNKVTNIKKFRKSIAFNEITVKLLEDLTVYLKTKLGHSHNTVKNHHKIIKQYVRRAIVDKIIDPADNPYLVYKINWEKTEVDYVASQELKMIENYAPKNESEQFTKDVFLFSCYTGLAYVEYTNISFEEIIENNDGQLFIKMNRQKSKSKVILPISKLFPVKNEISKPERILRKYMSNYEIAKDSDRKDRLFFKISNQKINDNLKGLATKSKINKALSSHMGRHTFGTLLCNDLRVPLTVVKELMSHSDISQTVKYVIVNDKVIDTMLKETNWNKIY